MHWGHYPGRTERTHRTSRGKRGQGAPYRHICARGEQRTERRFCSRLSGRAGRVVLCGSRSTTPSFADRRFDEFAEVAGIGDGRSGRLSSAPFRRVLSRLPATLHDGIREQIDQPSALVTDWLNLHTPVGREYVGHRRVDHERRVRPRRTVRVQLHRDPYLSPAGRDVSSFSADVMCASLASRDRSRAGNMCAPRQGALLMSCCPSDVGLFAS
jgi:hypothetical protein